MSSWKKAAFSAWQDIRKNGNWITNLKKLSESCIFFNLEETFLLDELQQG